MTQERMKLIAFNTARRLVLKYDIAGHIDNGKYSLVALCDKAMITSAAKESQINTIIDTSAYEAIISNEQFLSTLETQVKSLINNRQIY